MKKFTKKKNIRQTKMEAIMSDNYTGDDVKLYLRTVVEEFHAYCKMNFGIK